MNASAVMAAVCSFTGTVLLIGGVAVVYWPAALMLAGVALLAAGLFVFDVTGSGDRRAR